VKALDRSIKKTNAVDKDSSDEEVNGEDVDDEDDDDDEDEEKASGKAGTFGTASCLSTVAHLGPIL
jgi:hypothetical protein